MELGILRVRTSQTYEVTRRDGFVTVDNKCTTADLAKAHDSSKDAPDDRERLSDERHTRNLTSIRMFRFNSILTLITAAFGLAVDAAAADPEPLRVGVTPVFPPMIYREGGKVVGVEADFAAALGRELSRPIKFVEVKWDEQFTALANNRTDIIMSSLSITRPRKFRAAFSKPYVAISQLALIRRTDSSRYEIGFPARPEGVIGVKKGTTGDFLVQQEFPQSKRKYFDKGEHAARALVKKQIDLFICDSPTVWWLEGNFEEEGLAVVNVALSEEPLAWAVRKSDTALLASVDAALEKMQKSGESVAIIKRWVPHFK